MNTLLTPSPHSDPDYYSGVSHMLESLSHLLPESVPGSTSDRISALVPHLPHLSLTELASLATKDTLDPLKAPDPQNPFGSLWNKATAEAAGAQLGLSPAQLPSLLSFPQSGHQLRQIQSQIATSWENHIKQQFTHHLPENLNLKLRTAAWRRIITRQVEATARTLPDQLESSQIPDITSAFMNIVAFAPHQKHSLKALSRILTTGRLGSPVNIVDLHCPPFDCSPQLGIQIHPSAADFTTPTGETNSRRQRLDPVHQFAHILATAHIPTKVTILVIDNDKLVQPDQEPHLVAFSTSLEQTAALHPLHHLSPTVVRASSLTHPQSFAPQWDRLPAKTQSALIATELQKLTEKPLPRHLQTPEFATQVARKLFLLQFAFGRTLPQTFWPAIFLQRSKAHQQSTEVFMRANTDPQHPAAIISHWQTRPTMG